MGSLDHAEVVLRLVQRLESSSAGELRKEFQQRGLAVETGMEKQDMVARLRNALVWEEMPLQGLQQTCQDKGYPQHWLGGPHQATKEELLKRLINGSGMALAPETRFKNFFSYGNQPSQQKQEPPPPGSQQRAEFDKAFRSGARPPEEEFDDGWHSKAEENRRAFASGKRNHSGMPGGQRGRNGPSPPNNYKVGSEEQNWWRQQQRQGQQSRQPQPPTIDKHFKVLGLPKTATHDEVRKAYRKLALQHHPDKNPGSKQATAERMFREVVEAYDRVCEYLGSSAS
ncbi:unnamed protein product [Polarella glacialis]|uniref:J domain-containing protein n=1 Tax=Polarella glacialis TaxID=89957 RepID=A0A813GVA5_POLGL|nr:unnamed protein product [Polarella glacialis]